MSRGNLTWLLGVFAVTLVGLSISYSAPLFVNDLEGKHKNIGLLIDVMEEVQDKYVRELDSKQMRGLVEDMVNGGLQQLDPHSAFINQDEFRQFQKMSQGRFGGIGIRITVEPKTGAVMVESPIVGTPAYKAGVLAGDIITKVDGVSTEAMQLNDVVNKIQGKPGEAITLTVIHEGSAEEEDVRMVRDEIHIDSVLGDLPLADEGKKWDYMVDKENQVAYVRISAFTETTMDELTKVVQELQLEGMKGLVIDLRNNPGGLLRAAVDVAGLFLPEGERVVSTKGRNQAEEVFDAEPPRGIQPVTNVPIAILLNRYSASASEIVAAALRDHLRAVIVGERSYGKGSVQNVIRLENGSSALKLTTASYWRPSNTNIHRFPDSKEEDEWGVKPDKDCEVKQTVKERLDYFKYRRDRDVIRNGETKKKDGRAEAKAEGKVRPAVDDEAAAKDGEKAADAKDEPFRDRVLDRAVEYIRGKLKEGGKAPADRGARAPANRTAPLVAARAVRTGTFAHAVAPPLRRQPLAYA